MISTNLERIVVFIERAIKGFGLKENGELDINQDKLNVIIGSINKNTQLTEHKRQQILKGISDKTIRQQIACGIKFKQHQS